MNHFNGITEYSATLIAYESYDTSCESYAMESIDSIVNKGNLNLNNLMAAFSAAVASEDYDKAESLLEEVTKAANVFKEELRNAPKDNTPKLKAIFKIALSLLAIVAIFKSPQIKETMMKTLFTKLKPPSGRVIKGSINLIKGYANASAISGLFKNSADLVKSCMDQSGGTDYQNDPNGKNASYQAALAYLDQMIAVGLPAAKSELMKRKKGSGI